MQLTRAQSVALTAGAVLGSLCLLAALSAVVFGVKPLMFKSGSMDPTIPTGGLALSIPVDAAGLRHGDIVSTENATGNRITHRVAAVVPAVGYTELTLKGDANDVVDAEIYAVTEVDRVFWSVPLLGYAVAWLSSLMAMFIGGLFTAYLLYIAFGRKPVAAKPSISAPTAGIAAVSVLLLAGGTLHRAEPASASFTSTATATSTFTAGTLAAPGQPVCALGSGNTIDFSWSHPGPVAVSAYAVRVNSDPVIQTTARSVSFKKEPARVTVRAGYQSWTSALLTVDVRIEGQGNRESVTCTLV